MQQNYTTNIMDIKLSKLSLFLLHLIFFTTLSHSLSYQDQETICNTTPYPTFCKSLLAKYSYSQTVQDYGRYCMSESLSISNNFQSKLNQYLQSYKNVPQSNTNVLKDCHSLTTLSIDFLSTISKTIQSNHNTLTKPDADQLLTMLSAVITNLDTCSDGLLVGQIDPTIAQDLSHHCTNGSMLHSVSLALFKHGWAPSSGKSHIVFTNTFDYLRGLTKLNLGKILQGLLFGGKRNWIQLFYHLCGVKMNTIVVVNPYGNGDFTTINDAIAAAPNNTQANCGYYGIYVVAGVYEEYVNVPSNKKYIFMMGDGINRTIITGNRSVGGGWSTFDSATFIVTATGFVAVDITIRNTAGAAMQQAVAVRNGADLSAFHRCSFEAYQDTLYTHSMRQFYRECDIYGTVDFIFGNAAVVLQDCNICSRQPLKGQFNPITAQGRTDPNQNTGTFIHHCRIRAADDLASSNFTVKTYLGRPWKLYSRTVYMQSFMDSLIDPAGWHEWAGDFALDTLYYAEFNNFGPGSDTSKRVTWPGYHREIGAIDACNFTVSNFIAGDSWLPSTGVPYNGGFYYL